MESEHKKICNELHELYKSKNEAYGNSFHQTYIEEGPAALRIRLSDKLNRFKVLSQNPDLCVYESVRDTLIDLANYAIMAVMELDKEKPAPKAERDDGTGNWF